MQGPKNHNGSAVGNRAYQGREQTRLETAPTRAGGRRGWKPSLRRPGQTRLETAPTERGLPVEAVGNRAYGTQVTGRRGL